MAADDAALGGYLDALRADNLDAGDFRLERGLHHTALIAPGFVARFPRAAPDLALAAERVAVLRFVATLGLPVATPVVLAARLDRPPGRAYVATSVVPGAAVPDGALAPRWLARALRPLLAALAGVNLGGFPPTGAAARYRAFRRAVPQLAREVVLPRLGRADRPAVEALLASSADLPEVAPRLVHADLVGANLRWAPDGRLVGVLDWDEARPDDPAIDACGLWEYGPEVLEALFDAAAIRRARAHAAALLVGTAATAARAGEATILAEALALLPRLAASGGGAP